MSGHVNSPLNGATSPQARLTASRAAIVADLRPAPATTPALLVQTTREHPWVLLGTAALAGALVVALRPWRWLPRRPVLLSLVSQLAWQALAARQARQAAQARGVSPPAPPAADGRTPS